MSRKNITVFVLAFFISSLPVFGISYYTCNFEPEEQINTWGEHIGEYAFVPDVNIDDQGDPGWFTGYWGNENPAKVNVTDSDTGVQCLHVGTYSTATQTLNDAIRTEVWFEFAFKPNFDGLNPSAVTWVKTTRGFFYDMVGFTMKLTAGTGKITIIDPYGEHLIGDFLNGQWQTISFRHRAHVYQGVDYLSGTIDVYMGKKYVTTIYTNSTNNALQTVCFSTALSASDWVNTGDWYIDSIYIGAEPVLAGYPTECGDRNTVYLPGDISGPLGVPDCHVDIYDLEAIVEQWLQ